MDRPRDRPQSPLRDRRKELQLRQADVAKQAGCAISLVSMVEAGYVPSIGVQERLAHAVAASAGAFW